MLPASFHDLTPLHELMERRPSGATIYADKGYNSGDDEAWIAGETGIRLVPRRRENMEPNTLGEWFGLRRYRGRVETVHSQLEAWGAQRLHARTHEGWLCKVLASVFALFCVNAL
jgi:IS5 family transposase